MLPLVNFSGAFRFPFWSLVGDFLPDSVIPTSTIWLSLLWKKSRLQVLQIIVPRNVIKWDWLRQVIPLTKISSRLSFEQKGSLCRTRLLRNRDRWDSLFPSISLSLFQCHLPWNRFPGPQGTNGVPQAKWHSQRYEQHHKMCITYKLSLEFIHIAMAYLACWSDSYPTLPLNNLHNKIITC